MYTMQDFSLVTHTKAEVFLVWQHGCKFGFRRFYRGTNEISPHESRKGVGFDSGAFLGL